MAEELFELFPLLLFPTSTSSSPRNLVPSSTVVPTLRILTLPQRTANRINRRMMNAVVAATATSIAPGREGVYPFDSSTIVHRRRILVKVLEETIQVSPGGGGAAIVPIITEGGSSRTATGDAAPSAAGTGSNRSVTQTSTTVAAGTARSPTAVGAGASQANVRITAIATTIPTASTTTASTTACHHYCCHHHHNYCCCRQSFLLHRHRHCCHLNFHHQSRPNHLHPELLRGAADKGRSHIVRVRIRDDQCCCCPAASRSAWGDHYKDRVLLLLLKSRALLFLGKTKHFFVRGGARVCVSRMVCFGWCQGWMDGWIPKKYRFSILSILQHRCPPKVK